CKLKALFFTPLNKDSKQEKEPYSDRPGRKRKFQLIETMRWSKKSGFPLLSYHFARMKSSAAYFGFSFNEGKARERLKAIRKYLNPAFAYRIRLLLNSGGEIRLSYQRIKNNQNRGTPEITLARKKTDSRTDFLYHKTTNRKLYDRQYRKAKERGFFDVIFENEKNEITEGAISNIFISKAKMYYTPPVSCGLLAGVYRAYFMKKHAGFISEKVLRRKDLLQADAIYLTNAVRGVTHVKISRSHSKMNFL
ncbi:MAG: aminotransferase class IV, partial [Candidatus Omnitrophota bacterium]